MSLITIIAGHDRSTSETPFKMEFRWPADDGPTLNAGLVAGIRSSIAKKPYIFVIFQVCVWGGGRIPCPLSGSVHLKGSNSETQWSNSRS